MPGSESAMRRCDLRTGQPVGVVGDQLLADVQLDAEAQPVPPAPGDLRLESDLPALQAGASSGPLRSSVAGTSSSQTVCQIPVVRGYQIECGSSCQSCLPRGLARSRGIVLGADHDLALRCAVEEWRQVDRERRVSAAMGARQRRSTQTVAA